MSEELLILFVLIVFLLFVLFVCCGMILIEFVLNNFFSCCWLEFVVVIFDVEDLVFLIEWVNGEVIVVFDCLDGVIDCVGGNVFLRLVRSFFFKKFKENRNIYLFNIVNK